jgi:hypothetical protein
MGATMFDTNRHDVCVLVVMNLEQIKENALSEIDLKGELLATLTTL